MKYFISASYNKSENPFPLYVSRVIDTGHFAQEWEDFLDDQQWGIEKLFKESSSYTTSNFTIISVSELK